jgi:hypothetical protein
MRAVKRSFFSGAPLLETRHAARPELGHSTKEIQKNIAIFEQLRTGSQHFAAVIGN